MSDKKRTPPQQRAIEVFCRELAAELNAHGLDISTVLVRDINKIKDEIDETLKFYNLYADSLAVDLFLAIKKVLHSNIPWTQASVKELLWKPLQKAMLGIESTTQITTTDPSEVHQVLMHRLGEKFGVPYIDFPSQR